jgi:mannose-6-phosphate isomerase-like protein (cupin superfamily)
MWLVRRDDRVGGRRRVFDGVKNMDRRQVSREWRGRGFSCDIWTDPPGQVWADFVHDSDELLMLIDGEIELRFGGQVLRPRSGEEILIPAREPHTVINTGKVRNHWYYGYRND